MTLTVTLDLPADVERELRASTPDLNAAATEALLVSLYRQKKISHFGLAKAMGLDRVETEALLFKHNVTEDLGGLDDYNDDLKTLRDFRTAGE